MLHITLWMRDAATSNKRDRKTPLVRATPNNQILEVPSCPCLFCPDWRPHYSFAKITPTDLDALITPSLVLDFENAGEHLQLLAWALALDAGGLLGEEV